jgi:flagellar basal-body rod protein FlgF
MDKLIYTAMTGAKQAMLRQDTLAHNLANANTVGYRADTTAHRAVPIRGAGEGTRVFAIESTPGTDFAPGTIQHTGRALDVAINSPKGYFVVQLPDGREAYTRAGDFHTDAQGNLTLHGKYPVMGDGGPINLPPDNFFTVAPDGTISASPESGERKSATVINRLRMVSAEENQLIKGGDGLFRLKNGENATTDENIVITPGAVEGSNVNVVDAMVGIIAVARQFEMQMKMLSTAQEDERVAARLLSSNG